MPKDRLENRDPFYLSSLEESILPFLWDRELYSYQIGKAYEETVGSELSVGSVYPTLRRLEKRGFIKGRWGEEASEERGGARRRYYTITEEGKHALKKVRETRERINAWRPAWETYKIPHPT